MQKQIKLFAGAVLHMQTRHSCICPRAQLFIRADKCSSFLAISFTEPTDSLEAQLV